MCLTNLANGQKNMIGTPIVAHLRLIDQPLLRVSSLLIRIAAYKRSVNGITLTLSGVTSTISILIRASTKFFVLELVESGMTLLSSLPRS